MSVRLAACLLASALATSALAADAPVEDASKGYTLDTSGSTSSLARGEKGSIAIVIRAQNGWHWDSRTPLKVELSAPAGLELPRKTLGKKDLADPKAESPRIQAPFTAVAAGRHEVAAKLDFFVCSAEACVKQVRQVTVPVAVR